jgi:hypothetical protein
MTGGSTKESTCGIVGWEVCKSETKKRGMGMVWKDKGERRSRVKKPVLAVYEKVW